MDSGENDMNKKYMYGIIGIVAAAVIAIVAVTLYGRTIQLNYIEQIHLQDGYLYYVDRGKDEELKIIRSNSEGKNGNMIFCDKNDRDKYRIIEQIFFDDEDQAYVLLKEINVGEQSELSHTVYQCDFAHEKLTEAGYDLTPYIVGYSQIQILRIRNDCLYYVGIPGSEDCSVNASVFSLDQSGNREVIGEVNVEYPYLNAQFFLSEENVLLWMDYAGEVYIRDLGTGVYLGIDDINDRKGVFKSLSDDGRGAYVLDYEQECIRYIDLASQSSRIIFSQEEVQENEPQFTFQNLQSIDCTRNGFCAGVEDENGFVSVCSYQRKDHQRIHQDIDKITITVPTTLHRMAWTYVWIILIAAVLCVYWTARVKYHFQTILVRLCVVFLLGLFMMDRFLEYWIGISMQEQLEWNQTNALSALGKLLKEDIINNIEENAQKFPSGDSALILSHRSINEGTGQGALCLYVYSIFRADEEGKLYVSESMSEYSGVPVEWVYTGEVLSKIYQVYDSGEVINKLDEDRNGKRMNKYIPLVLGNGKKYGVLAVSVDGNMQDYQVWYYQRNLKNASSMLLFALTVVLMVILYIFLRPLKTLKECAGKLAAGDLGVTVEVHGQDEVADISQAFNQMSLKIAQYIQDIKSMSDGYYKFIPAKILDMLDKESIQEVKLGDQMTGEFTILSLHAIDYPKQSVSLSAEQVYNNINKVLSVLVEPINSHSGIVEHFEDAGLTALFTAKSREALDAAIDMQRLMPGNGRTIAISYGQVMIGVVGHEQRMEATAISAHSDLAKTLRLRGDQYGAHILITHLVYEQIPGFEEHYHARYLGNIYLTANDTYERVYDVYDGDSEEEFYNKERTKQLFERGVGLFVAKKFYEARLVFVEVLKQYRKDKAAKEYLYRCDQYYKLANEEDVETVIEKF
ncbi:MAG: HAMP domain-containing protein [Lachnospiraceae bacterium]|nr:HAMP domain-containing protein [Lachnospiraceae bacterium]